MFKNVYLNRITVGLDLMIRDILLEANHVFKFHGKTLKQKWPRTWSSIYP